MLQVKGTQRKKLGHANKLEANWPQPLKQLYNFIPEPYLSSVFFKREKKKIQSYKKNKNKTCSQPIKFTSLQHNLLLFLYHFTQPADVLGWNAYN